MPKKNTIIPEQLLKELPEKMARENQHAQEEVIQSGTLSLEKLARAAGRIAPRHAAINALLRADGYAPIPLLTGADFVKPTKRYIQQREPHPNPRARIGNAERVNYELAAELIPCSVRYIRNLVEAGKLKRVGTPRKPMIAAASLLAFLNKQK